jgi:hypothetical protein
MSVAQQQNPIGLKQTSKGVQPGFVLFAPLFSKTTYLIDRNGKVAHTWISKYNPAQSVYLLDNGNLLHTGNDSSKYFYGGGGVVEILNAKSEVLWQHQFSDSTLRQHHDVCPMPNGHILVLCWEKMAREEAIRCGRDPQKLGKAIWSEKILEVVPIAKDSVQIVWQWRIWDHLIQNLSSSHANFGEVSLHPEKLDINFLASVSEDWLHFNSLDYNVEQDQILISNRNLNEIYIIDHSTSTKEAASGVGGRMGRGGDLIVRWGNESAYKKENAMPQMLFRQHHATWIRPSLEGAGEILLFNNGVQRNNEEKEYSEVISIVPSVVSTTVTSIPTQSNDIHWSYKAKDPYSFFSFNVSSAQRLPNGNTLICEGAEGRLFEINSQKEIVWEYINPFPNSNEPSTDSKNQMNQVFRCTWQSSKMLNTIRKQKKGR